ncbi:MAG: LamG domain-containing protein [Kineosporiaceae bacterium]
MAVHAVLLAALATVTPQSPRAHAPGWATPWSRTTSNPSATTTFAWNSYPTTLVNDSSTQLAAHWRFSESNSTLVQLGGTTNYGGSYVNSPTYQQTGGSTTADKSVRFNGTSQYAQVNHHVDLSMNNNQPFSLEVVFKLDSLAASGNPRLIGKNNNGSGAGGYEMAYNGAADANAGQVYCSRQNSSGTISVVGSAGLQLPVGQWVHLVCTYDGSNLRFYWNGALRSGPTAASGTINNNTQNLYIGALSGSGNYAKGWFDEAAIFWTALSDRQVRSHYAAFVAAL